MTNVSNKTINTTMYSDKENINILTALLMSHGVEWAVVCPGSRNAPIVHNLNACGRIRCCAITDERSAAFYALGMAQSLRKPVVICVTSGSALLNVAPAVAEAAYQHLPLVVISADRPAEWIDQLDGQTLRQPAALADLVAKSVTIPEPHNDGQRWHCQRLINEALLACRGRTDAPVHINVPISEPLFNYNIDTLPAVAHIASHLCRFCHMSDKTKTLISQSDRILMVIGQTGAPRQHQVESLANNMNGAMVVWHEPLSGGLGGVPFDMALQMMEAEGIDISSYHPNLIIYIGDTLVSKRGRQFLRQSQAPTILFTQDATHVADPTQHLVMIEEYGRDDDLVSLFDDITITPDHSFISLWNERLQHATQTIADLQPEYSYRWAVKYLEEQLDDLYLDIYVHYANSMAVRYATLYANHYVYCNRGVNGIEGTLSTSAGFSIASPDDLVLCVIGDLSFFYDQNALWNRNLGGNLRVMLVNDHGGGIFANVKGMPHDNETVIMVAGSHTADARGICTQNDIGYIQATNIDQLRMGIVQLLTMQTHRPVVLEVLIKN